MFISDPTITDSFLREKSFVKVLFSMNNHEVATPEMNVEEARSYVFFFREGQVRRSAFIGLHLLHSDRKLFYTYTSNPFPEENILEVEEEARSFAEDLGAMLDEIDFSSMSDLERDQWINGQSIFSIKQKPESEGTTALSSGTQSATEAAALDVQPVPEIVPETPSVTEQLASVEKTAQEPPHPEAIVQPVIVLQNEEVAGPVSSPAAPKLMPMEPSLQEAAVSPSAAPHAQSVEPTVSHVVPSVAATKKRQEIIQKAIKSVTRKPLKQSSKNELLSSSRVVSRDREALARLLTSF